MKITSGFAGATLVAAASAIEFFNQSLIIDPREDDPKDPMARRMTEMWEVKENPWFRPPQRQEEEYRRPGLSGSEILLGEHPRRS